jgi:putative ABC transport system ATP-binding protein
MSGRAIAWARGVGKTYRTGGAARRALENIDFEVEAGELVLLRGPSGSGKTTLLSILGCILKPSRGTVSILGREVSSLPESSLPAVRLRHVGFVFQSFNLWPALMARENVQVPLDLKGVARRQAERDATEALERVGLGPKRDELPGALSGGEQQRVAVARALVTKPDLVLADEPTAALDWESGRAIMQLLRECSHEDGRAVVTVSHDPRLEAFADRVVRLEDGRLA